MAPHIGVLYRSVIPYIPGFEIPGTIFKKALEKASDFTSSDFDLIPTPKHAAPCVKFDIKKVARLNGLFLKLRW